MMIILVGIIICQSFVMNYYNDTSTFLEIENIRPLFSDDRENIENIVDIDFTNKKYKWRLDREEKAYFSLFR
jgi:hypothetical protein